MRDLRPTFAAPQRAFGLDATVTVPGQAPVPAVVFWLPPVTEPMPVGAEFTRAEARRTLAIPDDVAPQVPRGTLVQVAEFNGGASRTWRVDEVSRIDHDHVRAVVVEVVP